MNIKEKIKKKYVTIKNWAEKNNVSVNLAYRISSGELKGASKKTKAGKIKALITKEFNF